MRKFVLRFKGHRSQITSGCWAYCCVPWFERIKLHESVLDVEPHGYSLV